MNKQNIPSHVAIIMDGNRRWAKQKGLPTLKGHEAGVEALEKIVEQAAQLGVKFLTVYTLSTENLRERDKKELAGLFNLMQTGYHTKLKKMMENGVKIKVLGQTKGLPYPIRKIIEQIHHVLLSKEKITLNIALNYGGKKELLEAIKSIIKEGIRADKVDEKVIEDHLYTKGMPDPQLFIRTGGRIRTSNFLLWQTAYSELYFTKVLWPDFSPNELKKALAWYQTQVRNFGK